MFRSNECIIMLSRIWVSATGRGLNDLYDLKRFTPLQGRGPRPKNASFPKEVYPLFVELASRIGRKCFDKPPSLGPPEPGTPSATNGGKTSLTIGADYDDPNTHIYEIMMTSTPTTMLKGVDRFRLMLRLNLNFHVYEDPKQSPSRSPSPLDTGPYGSPRGRVLLSFPTTPELMRGDGASTSGRS